MASLRSLAASTLSLCSVLASGCPGDDGPGPEAAGSSSGGEAPTGGSAGSTAAETTTGEGADSGSGDSTGPAADPVPKSLVIAIDGLRPDALAVASTPAFDSLVDGTWQAGYQGAYAPQAQCLTDTETWSGPNHWAIMTGAIGAQHGVMGNFDVGNGDGRSFPHYLSLMERADASWATAYLFTWEGDLEIPCEADYIRQSVDADNTDRVAAILAGTLADDAGDLGTAWGQGTDPDAVFLFLDDVDHAGHLFGFTPDSPEYVAEIEDVDAQLGQILDALAARPSFADESWQIIVTTDHGGTPDGHGGDSAEELTIPFLVAGRDVVAGTLPSGLEADGTRIFDTVPTVLTHMGLEVPAALTGHSRAAGVAP